MDFNVGHAASVFAGFFAIMNPIANTPVFLALTQSLDTAIRKQIARRALIAAFCIIVVFSLAGSLIFEAFGITLPAFRIAGGLLVFLVGFHMLQGEQSVVQQPSGADAAKSLEAELDIAISPLALPILAGPGTIATAINFSSAGGRVEFVVTIATFLLLCLITYAFFVSGERFVRFIGENGIKVVTRIMGLILAVVGTQMVIAGIGGAFPSLATLPT